jgi:hypothetical protein
MPILYKTYAYGLHSQYSEDVKEVVTHAKRYVYFEVCDSETNVSIMWVPYWSGDAYGIYYVRIGDRKVMIHWSATLVVKAKTIDELVPIAQELSLKIIKALSPVAFKYLLVKVKRIINRDEVLKIVCETFNKEVGPQRAL